MNKLAIFDLDGTLLDTVEDISIKLSKALVHFGYPPKNAKEVKQIIGNGSKKLVYNALPVECRDQAFFSVFEYFSHLYANDQDGKTKPFKGIKEVLHSLLNAGYKLAIITNKPKPATDKICSELLFDIPFYKIIGQSEDTKCKPDPESTLKLLKELNVESKNAYFIGDGETDYQTAKNSNINHVSVLWGYRTKSQLQSAGASVFAQTPQDILKILPL